MKPCILIIDDDRQFTEDFSIIAGNDFNLDICDNAECGLKRLLKESPDIVLLDLMLGEGVNGLDVLKKIVEIDENLPVIMITDYGSIDTAVEAIRLGAFDYISKTPNMAELKLIINKSLEARSLKFHTMSIQEELQKEYHKMVGMSPAMSRLREKIVLAASNLNTVLITGESGVGKELVARQIHQFSSRKDKPFVPLNCAAIPKTLLESELFGHEKGAFTGATQRKIGKFEIASDGVLFFDEISELDTDSQVKLLRVIQEKEFERIGGNRTIKTDAKIIAASNRNLEELVKTGEFRDDLFYRLDVFPVHVPALRERFEDVHLLAKHFVKQACNEMKISLKSLLPDTLEALGNYQWPGNIRELKNHMTRAVMTCRSDQISSEDLDPKILLGNTGITGTGRTPTSWSEMDDMRKIAADNARREVEIQFLKYLMQKFEGNVSKAAEHVGINRTNLHKMLKRCGL